MTDHAPALEQARVRFYRQLMALGTIMVLLMYSVSDTFVFEGCRPEFEARAPLHWLQK